MKHKKSAFTMIELIFVMVILGVLATVALPRFGGVKNTSDLAKAKSDVVAIRSAIMTERQSSLVRGTSDYIPKLTPTVASNILFTGDGAGRTLLSYGIRKGTGAGDWNIVNDTNYTFNSGTQTTTFSYDSDTGLFTCAAGVGDCDKLSD